MSNYPPPGGQGQYGQQYPPPNQGYYQQQPAPMNQGYPPQQPPPQGYGYGQQQFPPQGPPQPYGGHSPQPPPGQYGGYGAPPPPGQGYGAPPPQQQQWGAPPPQQQHGYGAQPGYGASPPAMPSLGYDLRQRCPQDMSRAADDLRAAMKGFGTNETALIKVLAKLDPLQIEGVKQAFKQRHHRDLAADIKSETSKYFREGLLAIVRGPLDQDCEVVHEAIKGAGTKESALDDVLLGRTNADLNAIKAHYQQKYRRTLESDVKGDLSAKTERMYDMVMAARREEESAPVIPQQVDSWVKDIYDATEGRTGTDQLTVCTILTSRSNGQIRAIAQAYKQKYHKSLEEVIRKEFSGHMEDALLFMVGKASDPAKHDADLLEDAMKGLGTKDAALVRRIVAIHWDQQRLQQCKAAYKHFYKRDLLSRVQGETSGDYEKLMTACLS